MPLRSKAQHRLFFSKGSPVSRKKALEFARATPDISALPQRVPKRKPGKRPKAAKKRP